MAKDNLVGCKLDDEELKLFNSLVFQSGLNQTDYIKSKIFPSAETEEDRQEIKDLLLQIKDQNDMIQKIILSQPSTDKSFNIKQIKAIQKQEYLTYALVAKLAMNSKIGQEETYEFIDQVKARADEIYGKED